jgi:hypothetical protein
MVLSIFSTGTNVATSRPHEIRAVFVRTRGHSIVIFHNHLLKFNEDGVNYHRGFNLVN